MRRHYIFFGRVQGVGFRFRAYHAAMSNGVTGFVRNLSDGTVEMEAEGTREAIDRTVALIGQGSYIQIDRMEVTEIPEKNDSGFDTW